MLFDLRKAYRTLGEPRSVCSDHRNRCKRLADGQIVRFDFAKHVGGLFRFGELVLTTLKLLGGLQRFGEYVFTTVKRVQCLQRFGECVLTDVKRVRSLQNFGAGVLTYAKRVGGY